MKQGIFIKETILDEELKGKINGKITMEEAIDIFRRKNVSISEDDLTADLRRKIQSGGGSGGEGGGYYYDDTDLRMRIGDLELTKVDAIDLGGFRKISDKIKKNDLDATYVSGIENKIAENESKINSLFITKASASELANYRLKNIKIALSDLSEQLQTLILGIDPELSGVSDVAIEAIKNYYGEKTSYSAVVQQKIGEQNTSLIDVANYIFANFRPNDIKIKAEEIEDAFLNTLIESNDTLKAEVRDNIIDMRADLEAEKEGLTRIVADVQTLATENKNEITTNNTNMTEKTTAISGNVALLGEEIAQLREALNAFINTDSADNFAETIDALILRIIEVETMSSQNGLDLLTFIALSDTQHVAIDDKINQTIANVDGLSAIVAGLEQSQNGMYNELNGKIEAIAETNEILQGEIELIKGDIGVIQHNLEELLLRIDELTN